MTEVRTFRAATMQQALDVVRRELGADAVILHTRQITQRRILPWRRAKEDVEITAGVGINIRPQPNRRLSSPAAESAESAEERALSTPVKRQCPLPEGPVSPDINRFSSIESGLPDGASLPPAFGSGAAGITQANQAANLSFRLAAAGRSPGAGPSEAENGPAWGRPAGATPLDANGALATQLDSIQAMLENLGRSRHLGSGDEIPGELFHLYTELIDADVEDDLARDLVFRLRQTGTHEQLRDTAAAKTLLTAMVESDVRCVEPITPVPGRRKVVALVGPTGVGKTTTIAKLAANFRLKDGVRMGLVTVDTYRIAAVEQLRTYAEIIDLPMKIVTSPLEMRRALDELTGLDLVLIDTAGRSPRDELQIQELKSLLSEAGVDEVHLVMSLTASLRSITAAAEKFSAAGITALVLTKLDEAAGMGSLLSVSRKVSLPISYLTTGQDVPDDIEPANASRIARLVLGQDRLFD